MMITVEVLPSNQFRVWKGCRYTMPLDWDELKNHILHAMQGEEFYKMRTEEAWHQHHLKELDEEARR